jgi:hypothetical protein
MDPEAQRTAVESVEGVPGWLLEEDRQKLYELASAAEGPILEIGTFRGKSAIVMATALRDTGGKGPIVTLDVDREGLEAARDEALRRGLADWIAFARGTVEALFRLRPGFAPSLVFLDGDHSRRGVARDLRALEPRVPRGALLLFHDFNDARNDDPGEPDYGVTEAVGRSWVAHDCSFGGVFGACGLYRRDAGPEHEGEPGLETAAVTDLGSESLSSWFERRVVGALSRRLAARRAPGGA